MMNINPVDSNAIWQRYCQGKDAEEEEIRQAHRELAKRLYDTEVESDTLDRQYNPQIFQVKQRILFEFWKHTRGRLGQNILEVLLSRHTPQALHKAAQALESKERRVLAQCMLNDRRAKDTTLSNDDRLADSDRLEDQSDYVAATAHAVQFFDYQKYRKTSLGPNIAHQQLSSLQSGVTANPQNILDGVTGLRYISRKERATQKLKNSQIYDHEPHHEITGATMYIPERSPNQQDFVFPEERAQNQQVEQPFVNGFNPRDTSNDEEQPMRLSVKMERSSKFYGFDNTSRAPLDTNSDLREQFSINKTQLLSQTSRIANDREFEEKNYVKMNLTNYDAHRVNEVPRENSFKDFVGHRDLPKDLSESMIERLNDKYHEAYEEANREYVVPQFANRYHSVSGAKVLFDVPYVESDIMQESAIISSLLSPQARALGELQRKGMSPDRVPRSTTTNPLDTENSEFGGSPTRSKGRVSVNKSSAKKKNVLNNRLFEQFNKEYYLKRDVEVEKLQKASKNATGSVNSPRSTTYNYDSPVKGGAKPKSNFVNSEDSEEFLIELTRIVNKTGQMPANYQAKLTEMLSLSGPKSWIGKNASSKVAQTLRGSPSPLHKSPVHKSPLSKRTSESTKSSEAGIDEYNFLCTYLETLGEALTARYLENLRGNLKVEAVRMGWIGLMSLLASFDKSVPLVNNRLDTSDASMYLYLSQPGKLTQMLKRIDHYLTQNRLSTWLFNEYVQAYDEFANIVSIENIDESHVDIIGFVKYVYFLKRFIDVAKGSGLIKLKKDDWTPKLNTHINDELIERAKVRREAEGDKPSKMEMVEGEHNLGIDFKAWEQHLKQMEQENLAIKKLQRLQKIKVENGEKREYERQLKEQQNKEIEDTREELLKKQQYEKEQANKKKQFDHEYAKQEAEWKRYFRDHQHQLHKEWELENFDEYQANREFNSKLAVEKHEKNKVDIQERQGKRIEIREMNSASKREAIQRLKEERVWSKAQELLQRQQDLIREREALDLNGQVYDKL